MCFWLIPESCIPIACTSVSLLTEDEAASPAIQKHAEALDAAIDKKIGDSIKAEDLSEELQDVFPLIPNDLNDFEPFDPMDPDATMPEADEVTLEAFDKYLMAEVLLPHGGNVLKAKVVGRKRDADGKEIGTRASNPILDTREYEVEFPDGLTDVFSIRKAFGPHCIIPLSHGNQLHGPTILLITSQVIYSHSVN